MVRDVSGGRDAPSGIGQCWLPTMALHRSVDWTLHSFSDVLSRRSSGRHQYGWKKCCMCVLKLVELYVWVMEVLPAQRHTLL